MTSAKSLEQLYSIINNLSGPSEATRFVSDIMYNVISDIREEGLDVTSHEIEKRLSQKACDYMHASKTEVA